MSGGSDRLAIIYNTERFDLLETQELHKLRYRSNGVLSNNMRGQLAARFRIKATGQEFVFAVNHLKCCGSGVDFRVKQVADIKDWAESLSVPAIVVGDFNTPVSPDASETKGPGFEALIDGGLLSWLAPPVGERVPTQCHASFMSMLDFIFVVGEAQQWGGEAEILFRDAVYCPNEVNGFSDHRPIRAVFELP